MPGRQAEGENESGGGRDSGQGKAGQGKELLGVSGSQRSNDIVCRHSCVCGAYKLLPWPLSGGSGEEHDTKFTKTPTAPPSDDLPPK